MALALDGGAYTRLKASAVVLATPGMWQHSSGEQLEDAISSASSRATMPICDECGCILQAMESAAILSVRTDRCTLWSHQMGAHSRRATRSASASRICWSFDVPSADNDRTVQSVSCITSAKKEVMEPSISKTPPRPQGEASVVIVISGPRRRKESRVNRRSISPES